MLGTMGQIWLEAQLGTSVTPAHKVEFTLRCAGQIWLSSKCSKAAPPGSADEGVTRWDPRKL